MANQFTSLIAPAFEGINQVSREMSGMARSVMHSVEANAVGAGQRITVPIVDEMVASDMQASNISSTGGDIPLSEVDVVMSHQRKVSFHVKGEERMAIGSQNYQDIFKQSVMQAARTLVNEIESSLCALAYRSAAVHGEGGTEVFGKKDDLTDASQLRKILDDIGTPEMNRALVLNTQASANLRGLQSAIFKVNESGGAEGKESGFLGSLFGFNVRESTKFTEHTKGTGSGYLVNHASGAPVGTTALVVDTGSGQIKRGDVITVAGSNSLYVVQADQTGDGTVEIAKPGLRDAVPNNALVSIRNGYTPSLGFCKSAFLLAMRPPALPEGGDAASDSEILMDSNSMLTFRLANYRQYLQSSFELQCVYGVKSIRPDHSAMLVG